MRVEELVGEPYKGLFEISNILGESAGSKCEYAIENIIIGENSDTVKGTITVIRSGKGILIKGEATVQVELTCDRCLSDFIHSLTFDIEEEILYQQNTVDNLSLDTGEDVVSIRDQNIVDVGELIRQYALINLPMKALCKPNCIVNKEDNNYGPS